jgi:hypothetical protein
MKNDKESQLVKTMTLSSGFRWWPRADSGGRGGGGPGGLFGVNPVGLLKEKIIFLFIGFLLLMRYVVFMYIVVDVFS